MTSRIVSLFLAWLVVFAGSFAAFVVIEPDDMGFTRGLNRVWPWALGQALALVLAVWSFRAARNRRASGLASWLGYAPILATLVEIMILGILIVQAVAHHR